MATHETNQTNHSPWLQTSAGLHMRADASEAGRLARLADVVLWLIEAQGLPRVRAVQRVADQLEAATPAPELFAAQPGDYARPIEGDAARFGYRTAQSWAFDQLLEEVRAGRRQYAFERNIPYSSGGLSTDQLRALRVEFDRGRRARYPGRAPQDLVEAGIPALLRRMRESWTKNWPKVATDAEFFQHRQMPVLNIAVRLTDAARIWSYGAAWLSAAVTVPATIAELAEALNVHPRGKPWPAEWEQLVRLEFQKLGGWKREVSGDSYTRNSKIQSLLAKELGRSRQALDRILKDGPPSAGASAFDRLAQSAGARRSA